MPILSDRQIRERCVPPTHRLDADKYYQLVAQPQVSTLIHHTDFRHNLRAAAERNEELKQQCMVPLTEEEIAAFKPMIEPFSPTLIREIFNSITKPMGHPASMVTIPSNPFKIISRGLTSFGYDVSLAEEFKIFTNINSTIIDPKRLDEDSLVSAKVLTDVDGARYVIMPPNSYMLGRTVEYFRIPRDIQTVCVGKSTYARAGAIINVTPIEPGFEGNVVIEIANSTSLPMKVYANEGISQFMFLQGSEECETSYADRNGKYQGQRGITLPKV